MGFATRKRLYRHMAFAHNVDPASEDNEANRELILNPPPLEQVSQIVNEIGLDGRHVIVNGAGGVVGGNVEVKKSKRGRRKGAKNRLKLDPDTGQLVRTLMKRPRKQQQTLQNLNNGDLNIIPGVAAAAGVGAAAAVGAGLKKNSKSSKSVPRPTNVILPTTATASAVSAAMNSTTSALVAAHAAAAHAHQAASAASVDENNAVAAAAILLNEHNASSLWWPPTFSGV